MADARFFENHGPFTIAQIAAICGGDVARAEDPNAMIGDTSSLTLAKPGDVSFFLNPRKFQKELDATKAAVVILHPDHVDRAPDHVALITASNPHKAYALVVQNFYPPKAEGSGISPAAHIDPTAELEDGVSVAPGVVIEAGVKVGAGTSIGPNSVIRENVQIGRNCRIDALVSISHALIGDKVILHPGVRIGQAGFGFAIDMEGHVMLPQLGRVLVQDRCNFGANSCIDRGAVEDTVIGEGTFLDNLVQIGHNCQVGRHCVMSGQVGISGSVVIEDYCVLGGKAGVANHVRIGLGSQVGGMSGVMSDVPPGSRYLGLPAQDAREFMKQVATLKRLAKKKSN